MTERETPRLSGDVAVIGGGPAGIAATVALRRVGRSVVVIDEGVRPGGQIWRHRSAADRVPASTSWLDQLEACGATVLASTSVVDARPVAEGGWQLLLEHDGRAMIVHASSVILATGARERFLPFPGWTLPGVVGVGGAQALAKGGLAVAGTRVVIAGSGPLLLPVAAYLTAHGAQVAVVAEQADAAAVARFGMSLWRTPALVAQALRYRAAFRRTPFRTGTWAARASGSDRVEAVTLTDGTHSWTFGCDLLAVAFGLVPNSELGRLMGCDASEDALVVDPGQRTTVPNVFAVGECTGVAGVDAALVEGRLAAATIVGDNSRAVSLIQQRARLRARARRMEASFALRGDLRQLAAPDTIVCRCEDVRLGDVRPEWSARQAKLYTRVGMGPCQGRVCGPALRFRYGWSLDTVRAPIQPVNVSTLGADRP